MNSSFFPLSPFDPLCLVIVLMVFSKIPSSLCNVGYTNCSNQVVCGNITANFPFWGNLRPFGCGVPELQLSCENSTAKIEINNVTYRVLGINQNAEIFRIAREDYLHGICRPKFVNSTFDPMFFEYVPDYKNITLIYDCPSLDPNGPRQFVCPLGEDLADLVFQIDSAQEGVSGPGKYCNSSVYVPVSQTFADTENASILEEGLKLGFEMKWRVDNTACSDCTKSQGVCGYDLTSNETTCYCRNQTHGSKSCTLPGSSKIGIQVKIGIAVSAIMATIIAVSVTVKAIITRRLNAKLNEKIEAFIKNYRALCIKQYPYSEVKKMTNKFGDKLGGGGFGDVYKGKLQDGPFVAVKVLNNSKCDGEDFINEVASISRTSHVNVVTLLGFCYERTKRALIYEYMPNGSLDKFIYGEKSPDRQLEWKTLYEIAIGIARGLEYLHRGCNTRIVHFDIKPHNILLDQNFCPKISDFGLAKLCKREQSKLSTLGVRGTTGYIAPEVVCQSFGEISYKSDVYSYGMMVLEMAGGRKNVEIGVSHTSEIYFPDWIYKHLESPQVLTLHGVITEEEEEMVRKMIIVGLWCIQTNPSERPSMTKVVEMLEGSLQSLQIPPKPSLSAPATATPPPQEYFSTTS